MNQTMYKCPGGRARKVPKVCYRIGLKLLRNLKDIPEVLCDE
jgi:hypothetical protein